MIHEIVCFEITLAFNKRKAEKMKQHLIFTIMLVLYVVKPMVSFIYSLKEENSILEVTYFHNVKGKPPN